MVLWNSPKLKISNMGPWLTAQGTSTSRGSRLVARRSVWCIYRPLRPKSTIPHHITGWSKETVDCKFLLTDPKFSKSVITRWFLESLYGEVLVFWCLMCLRCQRAWDEMGQKTAKLGQKLAFLTKYGHFGPFNPMPDLKTIRTSCLGGFSVMWIPKLLLTHIEIRIFGP